MWVRAHGKVNLDLRVAGRRADGYHELRTVFQAISLHDTLICTPHAGAFELDCDTPGVPLDPSNLVWRAAEALWGALGRPGVPGGLRIRIEKRIPPQAGLGGGSANAAAALLALGRLWRAGLPAEALTAIAGTLGADVPFFLTGGTALGLGRGDDIQPLADLPPHWLVLLVPSFGVSTADAFRWHDARSGERGVSSAQDTAAALPGTWPADVVRLGNDLEAAVERHHPEIGEMKAALRRAGALAAVMSGSGSAVFGVFERRPDAVAAAATLSATAWRVLLAGSLGRAAYARRSRVVRRRNDGPLPASAGLDYT
jgi:4-diphosphocytidyl-2-C-methyl-D-erythritol kinase